MYTIEAIGNEKKYWLGIIINNWYGTNDLNKCQKYNGLMTITRQLHLLQLKLPNMEFRIIKL